MKMQWFARLTAALARIGTRGATRNMLWLDDHILRDIGLTRADVADCMSSPWGDPADFLHVRQVRNFRSTTMGANPQAAAQPDRLAA